MNIGQKLKAYLAEHKISQVWLCEQTGISPSRMSLLMNGKRRMTFDDYVTICYVLNIAPGTFIEPTPPRVGA